MFIPEHPATSASIALPVGASHARAGVADAGQEPIGKKASKVMTLGLTSLSQATDCVADPSYTCIRLVSVRNQRSPVVSVDGSTVTPLKPSPAVDALVPKVCFIPAV